MAKAAIDFWKDFKNHQEIKRQLIEHGLIVDATLLERKVGEVAKCWVKVASTHLSDARESCKSGSRRSFYSRNYYAVYNASKAVRYVFEGSVSGRGDDHQRVSDLPNRFPDQADWGRKLRKMYEMRLIADYDGWPNSIKSLDKNMESYLNDAESFVRLTKTFLRENYGIKA